MYNYLDGYAVFTDEKLFSQHDFYRRDKITPFPIFLILCGRNVSPSLLIPPCEAPIHKQEPHGGVGWKEAKSITSDGRGFFLPC